MIVCLFCPSIVNNFLRFFLIPLFLDKIQNQKIRARKSHMNRQDLFWKLDDETG